LFPPGFGNGVNPFLGSLPHVGAATTAGNGGRGAK
jgi:hypothetical protein